MKHYKALLLVLSAVALSHCALYAHVPMVRPAEVNIAGIHKIGLLGLPPTSEAPRQFSRELTEGLAARLLNHGYFTVTERAELEPLAVQLGLPMEALSDASGLAKIGQAIGVDAVIAGSVEYLRIQEERGFDILNVPIPAPNPPPAPVPQAAAPPPPPPSPPPRPSALAAAQAMADGAYMEANMGAQTPSTAAAVPPPPPTATKKKKYFYTRRSAELRMNLKLCRTAGGDAIYSLPISLTARIKAYDNPQPNPAPAYATSIEADGGEWVMMELPTPEAFVSALASRIPQLFVPHIVPTYYTKTIEFAKDDHTDNKRGLEFVKANAWKMAQQAFSDGIQKAPNNAPLHYNLGISLEANGDLQGARREYETALQLDPGRSLFQQTYRAVQQTIAEQEALQRQTSPSSQ